MRRLIGNGAARPGARLAAGPQVIAPSNGGARPRRALTIRERAA
jgi:hypothetical protein